MFGCGTGGWRRGRAEGLLAGGGGGEGGRWASFCREIVGLLLLQLRLRIPVAIGLNSGPRKRHFVRRVDWGLED
jgi:hypothetical protein